MSLSPHCNLPSCSAAPPLITLVIKIPVSPATCSLPIPPAMLNPRPASKHVQRQYTHNHHTGQSLLANTAVFQLPFIILLFYSIYTVSQKNCTPKAGRHKLCYFPNTKEVRNTRFLGNFILNKSCEFYYDDVTMTSFIGNK